MVPDAHRSCNRTRGMVGTVGAGRVVRESALVRMTRVAAAIRREGRGHHSAPSLLTGRGAMTPSTLRCR